MTNSTNKSVVLISPSDVVLAGLAEILKNSQAGEIIQLHRGEEITDYPQLGGNLVVLASSDEITKNGEMIRRILSAGRVQFMHLALELPSESNPINISLFDSPSLICYKVNEALNSLAATQAKEPETELSRRETEVLQLVCKGYSNKEIADQLFVSIHTVISHRKNISEKTGIKSASGLTMYAILKKIIDISEINTSDLI